MPQSTYKVMNHILLNAEMAGPAVKKMLDSDEFWCFVSMPHVVSAQTQVSIVASFSEIKDFKEDFLSVFVEDPLLCFNFLRRTCITLPRILEILSDCPSSGKDNPNTNMFFVACCETHHKEFIDRAFSFLNKYGKPVTP